MDAQSPIELLDTQTNSLVIRKLNLSATISHELLGHGVGITSGSNNAMRLDAVQMKNLSYRIQGLGRLYTTTEDAYFITITTVGWIDLPAGRRVYLQD